MDLYASPDELQVSTLQNEPTDPNSQEIPPDSEPREAIPKTDLSFAGGVMALGGGAAAAHLIAFVCAPVVNRLFGPEAFGAATIFTSALLVIGIVSPLRYESALMLPRQDRPAANLLILSCLCVAIVTGVTCLLVALFGDAAAAAVQAPVLAKYKWLLPAGVFAWGVSLPLRAWATRHKRFKSLGALSTAETATSSLTRIAAGWVKFLGAGPLIITGVLARAVPPAVLICKMIPRDVQFIISHCRWRRIIRLAGKYIRFPLIESWSAVLGQLSRQIPYVLLAVSFGPGVAGHYSRAVLLTHIPFLLAGNAIRQVFFRQAAAEWAAGRPISELVEQVFQRLVWISMLPMAMVVLIGPDLFEVILGTRWGPAGAQARLLAGWLLLAGLTVPLSGLFSVLGYLGTALVFSISLLTAQTAALIVGGWFLRDEGAAIGLLAIAGAVINAASCWFLLTVAGIRLVRAVGYLLRYLAYASPALVITAIAKWWLHLPAWAVVLVAVGGSIIYLGLVLHHDRWARGRLRGISANLVRRFVK